MKDRYILLKFSCPQDWHDILIAELNLHGFDSFEEFENGFRCSMPRKKFDPDVVHFILDRHKIGEIVSFKTTLLENENWNWKWESNYPSVIVEDRVLIRASFHPASGKYPYEVVIDPRMSFGTGHHETTALMIRAMLKSGLEGKRVLDAGCGTGILSILAEKMGASRVTGCDTDEQAVENAVENACLNKCSRVRFLHSSVGKIKNRDKVQIILANINRNILLDEIRIYTGRLDENGVILLSGFYKKDAAVIGRKAKDNGLQRIFLLEQNGWVALAYEQNTD